MSDPTPITPTFDADGRLAPGRHRMEIVYIALSSFRILLGFLFALIVGYGPIVAGLTKSGVSNIFSITVLFIALIVLLVAAVIISLTIYYKRFSWEITANDIHIHSGIIVKKQVHIPFSKVQSIDYTAPLLARLLGVVNLKIETAGGAINRGVEIPALKLNTAEAFKTEVFKRKRENQNQSAQAQSGQAQSAQAQSTQFQTAQALDSAQSSAHQQTGNLYEQLSQTASDFRGMLAGSYEDSSPVDYQYGLSIKELLLSALANNKTWLMALILIGMLSQVGEALSFIGISDRVEETAVWVWAELGIVAVIIATIFSLLLLWLLSVVAALLSYGGFKASRRGGRIEVERGLLQRHYKGVALSRVQGVVITQGLVRKLMGFAEIKLEVVQSMDTSGGQQSDVMTQGSGLILHPFVRLSRVDEIIANMVPDLIACPQVTDYQRLPRRARRRSIIRWFAWPSLICIAAVAIFDLLLLPPIVSTGFTVISPYHAPVLIAIVMALCLLAGIWWYKRAAYAYNSNILVIRQGIFGQKTTLLLRKKIQWAALRQNPLQRCSKLASISAVTAAGTSGTTTRLRDLNEDEASAYLDWVRPRNRD
ncbi:MAG: PH domain-containing protein [Coriobacteriaceae bacterium]|nr:PH domain-containing protein [Coriobacteriaceae bacterium]